MALLKCKMCGGDLNIVDGSTVCVCEYCGTKQTVPSLDNEKKITLFQRANRLRLNCEFDKAYSIYETIIIDYPEEAEAYWGLVLCKYGVEYVDDPKTAKKIPTCHRSSFESVMDDPNYELVLEYADTASRAVYRQEAKTFETIRKGIIEISSKEEPYDIFICYKETDENGERTIDSVIAQDVYDALVRKNYRVFFARITLEDKLGQEYEPYIFSALHSSRVMLVFGTDYDYFNAVWVKNEWSRFLKLIEEDKKKTLIPCYKGIDAYDMPKEFAKLQAQDMGKVGALQDLLRGIDKILAKKKPAVQETVVVTQSAPAMDIFGSILKRAKAQLESGDFEGAKANYQKVLDFEPEHSEALLGLFLGNLKVVSLEALENGVRFFIGEPSYAALYENADDELKARMGEAHKRIEENNLNKMQQALKQREFDKVEKYANNLMSFTKTQEATNALLYASLHVSTYEELCQIYVFFNKNKIFVESKGELRKNLEAALQSIKQNNIDKMNENIEKERYAEAGKIANYVLEFDSRCKEAKKALICQEFRVKNLSLISKSNKVIITTDVYKRLGGEKSDCKDIFISAIEGQKLHYANKMDECLSAGEYSTVIEYCKRLFLYNKNNEKAVLYLLLAKNGVKEISALPLGSENTPEFERALMVCTGDVGSALQNKKDKNIAVKKRRIIKSLAISLGSVASVVLITVISLIIYFNSNRYIYGAKFENDTAIVTTYRGKDSDVKIPSEIGGKPVVEISQNAFANKNNVKTVYIPTTVKKIGENVFSFQSIEIFYCEASDKYTNWDSMWENVDVVFPVPVVWEYTGENGKTDGFRWASTSDGYAITGYYGSSKDVTIPKEINGQKVVKIINLAFKNQTINKLTIPSNITTIEPYSFYYAGVKELVTYTNAIKDISIPELRKITFEIPRINKEMFADNTLIEEIVLGEAVYSVGYFAFARCTNLRNITMSASMNTLESCAFVDCKKIQNVFYSGDIGSWCQIEFATTDSNPLYYGADLYIDNRRVTEAVIPGTVEKLGQNSFANYEKLTSVTVCDGVTSIGSGMFKDCDNLLSIKLPDSLVSVGAHAFDNCDGITNVELGNKITEIGAYAFENCDGLINVTIFAGNDATIGTAAFSDCSNLINVTMSDSVTNIGSHAFSGCKKLTRVKLSKNVEIIGDYAFYNCNKLKDIELGESLKGIGRYAFSRCASLTSIIIPSSVEKIYASSFNGCTNLVVYCEVEKRPSGWVSSWADDCKDVIWGYTG